jgi:two-component system, OmpR family, alkaline phosphatase synthesis response regulator PhoP
MSKTLLIVDDDEDIRDVAALALEIGTPWTLLTAASGAAGIDALRSVRPDAILLDVMMPGLDGPATLEALRQDPRTRDIPVIFLTAKARPADRDRLQALDVVGVLAKPFDPIELPGQIAGLLGWTL